MILKSLHLNRPNQNFIINFFAFTLTMGLIGTGVLIHFRLPAGSGSASALGLTRHEWGDVHFWLAVGFTATIVTHLILHAKWISALTIGGAKSAPRSLRFWTIMGLSTIILALTASTLFLPVTQATARSRGGRGGDSNVSVNNVDSSQAPSTRGQHANQRNR